MVDVNYLAVLVAGVVNIIIGFLWYGPVFGKKWMAMMGMGQADIDAGKAKGGMGKSYFIAFVGSLVTAYVLAYIITISRIAGISSGVSGGLSSAFWVWLGFFATSVLASVLREKRTWSLYFLNVFYHLVNLLVMGAILAA